MSKISVIIKCSKQTIQLTLKSIYLQHSRYTVAIKLHTGIHISYHGPSIVGTITVCVGTANEVITSPNYRHTLIPKIASIKNCKPSCAFFILLKSCSAFDFISSVTCLSG